MVKKTKSKFALSFYDNDRKYAIAVYLIYILISLGMIFFANPYYQEVQGPYLPIYTALTSLVIGTISCSTVFCIMRKSMWELFTLSILLITFSLIFIEKTLVFIITPLSLSIGIYIDYMAVTVFKLVFIIYRFLRVNRTIKKNKEYDKIFAEQNIHSEKTERRG